jgi:hypothetical protein
MLDTVPEVTTIEAEQEEITYFDPKRLLRICSICDAISNLFLVLAVLLFIYGLWLFIQSVVAMGSLGSFAIQALPLVLLFGFFTLLSLFFWMFLRAISEGLFLLMDIQDNTRPDHVEK